MRAMGADLLTAAPPADEVHDARASVWVHGSLLRAQFLDAAGTVVAHDLDPVVGLDDLGDAQRRHLLLIGSRAADVRAYARNLHDQGWREMAHSAPAALGPGQYAITLVDHPA
ncbi:hypothetical protein [Nocardioides dongkuii]|uniref:hypothetical protein n=1 Tax=Nocardioides dongkuii TaxID=2760089 RepID=UPI0015F85806|nr:hypothetical protein [Nocardioides dongkuii]